MISQSIKKRDWSSFFEGDKQIWTIFVLLSLLSIPVVFSSIYILSEKYDINPLYYLGKQFLNVAIGLIAVFGLSNIATKWFNTFAFPMWLISLLLLVYTSLFAPELNNARRWIELPFTGMSFQPSGLAKISLIILIAQRISSKQKIIKRWKEVAWPLVGPTMLSVVLIAFNDLSTALLLLVTIFLMMFVGRISLKFVFVAVLIGVITVGSLFVIGTIYPDSLRSGTWKTRIVNFIEDTPDYQIGMRQQAMSHGGIIGVGPGKSLNKNYFNSPYSDFIYAVICEEYGLIGALVVIFLYLWLFWRVFLIVIRGDKAFGAMLSFGLGFIIVFQAILNMLVTLNLLPATGLPLPMISKGGTSNLITGISFGIIIGVSKLSVQKELIIEINDDEGNS